MAQRDRPSSTKSHALHGGVGSHLLHVVQTLRVGGIETLVLDLLDAEPDRHVVVCLEGRLDDLAADWQRLDGLRDRIITLEKAPGFAPRAIVQLARVFRRQAPSAVVLHHIGPLLYGSLAARLAGVRSIVHYEHDAWHYTETPRHVQFLRAATRLARIKHVAASDAVAERLSVLLGGQRVDVVTPGIDQLKFRPGDRDAALRALGLAPAMRWIGTVGRLVAVKDHATLLTALARLPATVGAILVGDGPERSALERQIAHLGLAERVALLGQRSGIESILPAFDAFVLSSRNEGLPRALLEAQACGIAVIATDVGGVRQAVCPHTGQLVPAADAEALAAAIARRLETPVDADLARQFVTRRFSLTAVRNQLDALARGSITVAASSSPTEGARHAS